MDPARIKGSTQYFPCTKPKRSFFFPRSTFFGWPIMRAKKIACGAPFCVRRQIALVGVYAGIVRTSGPQVMCVTIILAYMGADVDEVDLVALESDMPDDNGITTDLSHLNAIDGRQHLKSFNIVGTIHKSVVNILVDNGSSHDFIHPRIAEKLSLSLTKIKPFRVYVGNGESLVCSHVNKETMVDLQGHLFRIDLHILDFHGPDIILGMEWLESLGRVTHDYMARTMEFFRDDSLVVLRGCSSITHKIAGHALAVLLSHTRQHDMLESVDVPPSSATTHSAQPSVFQANLLSPILRGFSDCAAEFRQPEGKPPSC